MEDIRTLAQNLTTTDFIFKNLNVVAQQRENKPVPGINAFNRLFPVMDYSDHHVAFGINSDYQIVLTHYNTESGVVIIPEISIEGRNGKLTLLPENYTGAFSTGGSPEVDIMSGTITTPPLDCFLSVAEFAHEVGHIFYPHYGNPEFAGAIVRFALHKRKLEAESHNYQLSKADYVTLMHDPFLHFFKRTSRLRLQDLLSSPFSPKDKTWIIDYEIDASTKSVIQVERILEFVEVPSKKAARIVSLTQLLNASALKSYLDFLQSLEGKPLID